PIGVGPDRGLVVHHRRRKGLRHIAGTVHGSGVGSGTPGCRQGKHADGKTAENRFHRMLIELSMKAAGPLERTLLPARGNGRKYGDKSFLYKGVDCKPLSRRWRRRGILR